MMTRIQQAVLANENARNQTLAAIRRDAATARKRAQARDALAATGLTRVGENLYRCERDGRFVSLVGGKWIEVEMPGCVEAVRKGER